jgi:hypothetical protein
MVYGMAVTERSAVGDGPSASHREICVASSSGLRLAESTIKSAGMPEATNSSRCRRASKPGPVKAVIRSQSGQVTAHEKG